MLIKSIVYGSTLGSFGQGRGDFLDEGVTCNTNIKQCLCKVADRQVTAAVKVLSSSGVTPYCDDTIKALEAKYPYKPPPSMPSITFSEPPLIAEIDSVFGCIKSFLKDTSCGIDGLRAQHILDALYEEGSATATNLLKVLSENHNDGSLAMLTVDFSNAFKLVDRSALLHDIKDNCKLILHAWYLNDGTVIGDSEEIARVLDIRKVSGPGLGLELNIKKRVFWASCNGIKLMEASRAQSWVLQDHILRDSGICGMDDDYVSALACLRDMIPSFDFSCFTNKDIVPSKAQQTLANVLFGEMVKDMEVHYDMETENNMEDDVDINALTIEQYIALIPNDIKPGIVNPKIGDDVEFEINANFMRE
ncbi:hypothetical protein Tco_0758741 [Tanacetum coccineum]